MGNLAKLSIAGCEYVADPSGHHVYHVNSPHALMQAVGYLKHTAEPWERIYLRGQGRLYDGLSPTLYRGISSRSQGKRHEKLSCVIEEFRSSSSLFAGTPDYAQEPLLQHYGIQTTWLDIVDNVWIALWFSTYNALASGPENQFLHFDARRPSSIDEFSYILLIKTEDSRRERVKSGVTKGDFTETIDLRISASSVFLRPHAQHGLLFRARGKEGGRLTDYSSAIAGIIRFRLQDGADWLGSGAMHNVRALFPPPYFDNGYQILLGVKQNERGVGLIGHIGA